MAATIGPKRLGTSCSPISKSGRCHAAWITPRIRLATSAPYGWAANRSSRRGSAKPRQPNSSPSGPLNTIYSAVMPRMVGQGRMTSQVGACAPSATFSATVSSSSAIGRPIATAYQPMLTRHCTCRRSSAFRPSLPSTSAVTISAVTIGPNVNQGISSPPPRSQVTIAAQVSAKVRPKNVTSGWRLTTDVIEFMVFCLSRLVVLGFVGRDSGDRQQRQAKIANLDQYPVQGGLVGQRPVQDRFAVGFIADRQIVEPG